MIAGIDPGSHGAISLLHPDGTLITVVDMPAVVVKIGKTLRTRIAPQGLALLLAAHKISHVYLEKVGVVPKNGALGSFVLGHAYGVAEGVIATLGIPSTTIAPAVWKKALGLPAEKGNSRARAMMLWPSHAAEFQRVKDDGRAEACLIAYYGMGLHRLAVEA